MDWIEKQINDDTVFPSQVGQYILYVCVCSVYMFVRVYECCVSTLINHDVVLPS